MSTNHLSDSELAAQPVAYWARLAYEATIGFIRTQQAEHGFTQPQFWLLRHLSIQDISPDGRAMSLAELGEAMQTFLREEDDLEAESATLLERGWLRRDGGGRLQITDEGEAARLRMKEAGPAIRERLHAGIDDADYVTTMKVLRRMISNTGGTP